MERRVDDLSFEGAWKNQVKEEQKEQAPAEQKEVKVRGPAFRGQRDVVETRTEIRMATKQQPAPEKKEVNVVAEVSSKEGDDFDVSGNQTILTISNLQATFNRQGERQKRPRRGGGTSMSMISVTLPDGSVNEYASGITAGEIVIDIEEESTTASLHSLTVSRKISPLNSTLIAR